MFTSHQGSKAPSFLALHLRWVIQTYPQRLMRFFSFQTFARPLDGIFFFVDILLILDCFELLSSVFKRETRALNDAERFSARMVFGNAIPLDLVRIDESARIGTRNTGIVYVSGFTINSWGIFSEAILIHELVHVWQYTQQGAAYIPRALRAQGSAMGYNYGGLSALRSAQHITDFNLEQQGDLVMDYFLILQDRQASWAPEARSIDLPLYETFMDQIRNAT